MNLRTLALAAALAPALAFAQGAREPAPAVEPAVKLTDAQLASKIHRMNQIMIRAGEIARKYGTTAEMKEFGRVLATDHFDANRDLTALAKKAGLHLDSPAPADKVRLDADEKRIEELGKLRGYEFERAFATDMFNSHRDVMDSLLQAEGDIQTPALKKYVSDLRSTLKHHEELAASLKGEAPSGRAPPAVPR